MVDETCKVSKAQREAGFSLTRVLMSAAPGSVKVYLYELMRHGHTVVNAHGRAIKATSLRDADERMDRILRDEAKAKLARAVELDSNNPKGIIEIVLLLGRVVVVVKPGGILTASRWAMVQARIETSRSYRSDTRSFNCELGRGWSFARDQFESIRDLLSDFV